VQVEEEAHGTPAEAEIRKKNEVVAAASFRCGVSQVSGESQCQGAKRFGVPERLRKGLTVSAIKRFVVACDFRVDTSSVPYRILETDPEASSHLPPEAAEVLLEYSAVLRAAGVRVIQTEVRAHQIDFVIHPDDNDAADKAFADAGISIGRVN